MKIISASVSKPNKKAERLTPRISKLNRLVNARTGASITAEIKPKKEYLLADSIPSFFP